MHLSEGRVMLNVGGRRYETFRSTLSKYPSTLLGTMFSDRNESMLPPEERSLNEHFIDRDGDIFQIIMNFYRTGKVIIPPSMPRELVMTELDYFQIPVPPGIKLPPPEPEPKTESLFLVIRQDRARVTHTQPLPGFDPNAVYSQNLYKISKERSEIVHTVPGCWNDENMLLKKCKMLNDQMNLLTQEGWKLHLVTYDQSGCPVAGILTRSIPLPRERTDSTDVP